MTRVIFLNCVAKDLQCDSIKLLYQQAHLLNEGGIEAKIFQPDGFPLWLDQGFPRTLQCQDIFIDPDDIVVFPLIAFDRLYVSLKEKWPCKKFFYCHDPYLMIMKGITKDLLKEWDILKIIVPNRWCKEKLKSFLNIDNIDVVYPYVNIEESSTIMKNFHMSIYWERECDYKNSFASFYNGIFYNKYHDCDKKICWENIWGKSESEKSECLRKSALCISFWRLETIGLKGLEAMAAGSLFSAPLGGGSSDYASSQNGRWFIFEDLESLADMTSQMLEGFERQSASYQRQLNEGFRVASLYTRKNAVKNVIDIYEPFVIR